jgi:phosphate transport system substrate-binding protein
VAISERGAAAFAPTRFTVATEDYPLARRLFLYAPAPATHPLAARFVAIALSAEGQTLVAADGLVDLAASERAAEPCTGCPPRYLELTRSARRLSIDFRFRSASTELDARGARDVSRLAALIRLQGAGARVQLLGFSDNQGDARQNADLASARARAVAERLEAYGVRSDIVEGFGAQRPVASNDTDAGRGRNRRVEVWLVQPESQVSERGSVHPAK